MIEVGVFLPIARNGYLISSASAQYSPTYDLNRNVAIAAERYGFDFALAMIKLRGYGGVTWHWDECLEAFTLRSQRSTRWRRADAASTLFQVGKRPNTSRWEFGLAKSTFAGVINIARSTRRFCRNFGKPGKAISKGNFSKWTTAAWDHCRPEKWRLSAPARAIPE